MVTQKLERSLAIDRKNANMDGMNACEHHPSTFLTNLPSRIMAMYIFRFHDPMNASACKPGARSIIITIIFVVSSHLHVRQLCLLIPHHRRLHQQRRITNNRTAATFFVSVLSVTTVNPSEFHI
jgi:hypothetical protein